MRASFLIPALNSEATIGRCVAAALAQRPAPAELILVDGGSLDRTVALARAAVAGSGVPFRLIRQRSPGLAAARNLGFRAARNRWVASCDTDVELRPGWLAALTRAVKAAGAAGACGRLDEAHAGTLADRWRATHMAQHWGGRRHAPRFLFGADTLLDRDAVLSAGGYDERFLSSNEDADLSARLIGSGRRLVYEPSAQALHLRRDTPGSALDAYWRWTFHGYPLPDSVARLALRALLTNPYKGLRLCLEDLAKVRPGLLLLDAAVPLHNTFKDAGYLLRRWRASS